MHRANVRWTIYRMARVRSIAVISAVLLAAGCGGGGSSGAPKPKPTATVLSAGDIKARLLTPADMPAGFTVDTDSTETHGTVSSPDPGCRPLADLLNSDGKPAGAVAEADASFTRSDLGPTIDTGLASFPSVPAAQSVLDTVATAIPGCTKLTETDKDGSRYDFTAEPLSLPAPG